MLFIMIPDFKGQETQALGTPDSFLNRVLFMYPDAMVVPILNGPNSDELFEIDRDYKKLPDRIITALCLDSRRGLAGATMLGFEHVLTLVESESEDIIVKLDTAEHPIEKIADVARAAYEHGAAVMELDFTDGGLVQGSDDAAAHDWVFPGMYETLTGGLLRLSCAHGFQGYSPEIATRALDIAKKIFEQVEKSIPGPCKWGMDAMMALGAAVSSRNGVHMLTVPAEKERNRSREKIATQYQNHLTLLQAATRLGII